jgi:hypothetical protein
MPNCSDARSRFGVKTRVWGIKRFRRDRIGGGASRSRGPHWGTSHREREIAAGSREYLQPEPMLQEPGYTLAVASGGDSVPVYSYAANNPVARTDADGLDTYMCTSTLHALTKLGGGSSGAKSYTKPGDMFHQSNPIHHQYYCWQHKGQKPQCAGQD